MLVDIMRSALSCDIVLAFVREKRREALRSTPIADTTQNASGQSHAAAPSKAELADLIYFTGVELESMEQCFAPTPKDQNVRFEKSQARSTA
ncbi:hypothetical protein HPB50_001269 [Hyalomma asiaticum]|uniref:Uncharacterized protein n=1 Tax=Hyalomma asiaticum TaxID=266040 RepID=A0ACB7RPZ9_HYAAI|nr:hypothetical protein HPB50_001269 [Hyalomma asiaticum]